MADALTFDPDIAALCDEAPEPMSPWTLAWVTMARANSVTPEDARDSFYAAAVGQMYPRPHTGYMPEPQRRNVRHRLYCDGLRTPRDRAARDMREMGVVR